jgi:hypothetical protein
MQNTNDPPVPAFELMGNVLPTLKPFFEFIAFLSGPVLTQSRRMRMFLIAKT